MSLEVEEIYLNPFHPSPGRIALSHAPTNPLEIAVDPIGGPAQVYGVDFLMSGQEIVWVDASIPNSDIKEVLDGGVGVTLRVVYERD